MSQPSPEVHHPNYGNLSDGSGREVFFSAIAYCKQMKEEGGVEEGGRERGEEEGRSVRGGETKKVPGRLVCKRTMVHRIKAKTNIAVALRREKHPGSMKPQAGLPPGCLFLPSSLLSLQASFLQASSKHGISCFLTYFLHPSSTHGISYFLTYLKAFFLFLLPI